MATKWNYRVYVAYGVGTDYCTVSITKKEFMAMVKTIENKGFSVETELLFGGTYKRFLVNDNCFATATILN